MTIVVKACRNTIARDRRCARDFHTAKSKAKVRRSILARKNRANQPKVAGKKLSLSLRANQRPAVISGSPPTPLLFSRYSLMRSRVCVCVCVYHQYITREKLF